MACRTSQNAGRGIGDGQHGCDAWNLHHGFIAKLGQRLRREPSAVGGIGRTVVEILCGARVAGRRLRLDRLRLSRRAYAIWLALDQLAVRHCGYVWLPQGQFLLLQSLVGIGTSAASVSSLELGTARR